MRKTGVRPEGGCAKSAHPRVAPNAHEGREMRAGSIRVEGHLGDKKISKPTERKKMRERARPLIKSIDH